MLFKEVSGEQLELFKPFFPRYVPRADYDRLFDLYATCQKQGVVLSVGKSELAKEYMLFLRRGAEQANVGIMVADDVDDAVSYVQQLPRVEGEAHPSDLLVALVRQHIPPMWKRT